MNIRDLDQISHFSKKGNRLKKAVPSLHLDHIYIIVIIIFYKLIYINLIFKIPLIIAIFIIIIFFI